MSAPGRSQALIPERAARRVPMSRRAAPKANAEARSAEVAR
jgi:hypothetical protein